MLVSHRKRFIYTKTAKTAGTSVESYFEVWCQAEGVWKFQRAREETVSPAGIIGYRGVDATGKTWFNHMPAKDIRRLVGEYTWDNYFKFTVIRNPFDKLLSGYFFSQRPTGTDAELIAGFRNWVKSGGSIIDRSAYTIDGALCLDYFIRYESLEEGVAEVCRRLGLEIDLTRLPRLKSGFRPNQIPLKAYYDKEVSQLASELYAFELDAFGYQSPV